MGTCGTCGKEIKKDAKFCKACGAGRSGNNAVLNDKKARIMGREQAWKKPLMIAATVVVVIGALWFAKVIVMKMKMGNRPMFAPHRDASSRLSHTAVVKSEGGDVRIPVQSIEDGQAHFFSYTAGGKTITFFVMKAADGSIRTALDACVSCNHAKLGYRQEGGLVVCNNCGMGFKPTDIGMTTGGCNPIPVNRSIDNGILIVKAKDIEDGAKYF